MMRVVGDRSNCEALSLFKASGAGRAVKVPSQELPKLPGGRHSTPTLNRRNG